MTGQRHLLSLCMQHLGTLVPFVRGAVRIYQGMRHGIACAANWRAAFYPPRRLA